MDPRLQRRVQRYGWDAASRHYNDAWSSQILTAHNALLEQAHLEPGQTVVETACGTGLVTLRIANEVRSSGRVIASDLSGEMIADLRRRAEAAGYENIDAERMDAERLSVDDGIADRSICALGLMYVPDPDAAIQEMARVLRPSGRAVALVWGERKKCGWAEIFPIVDAKVQSEVCPMFFATGQKGILARSFKNAGLYDVSESRLSTFLEFPSEEAVVTSALRGGPVALAAKRFSTDTWGEVATEYLASVANFRRADGTYRIPGEFVTVTGKKRDAWRDAKQSA